ncbi:MAG: CAP domain-containing protein [Thermoleophilia bacterium]|nr:CAP domain-containing protein [Thermoleophilia bacterium]
MNWARARDGRRRLAPSRALRRAAVLKGIRVAACGALSHAPCGTDVTAAVRAVGYRYARFGETLFATSRRHPSARSVVAAWLRSPPHRETLLDPEFRELGAARIEAPTLLGSATTVWVTALATPD